MYAGKETKAHFSKPLRTARLEPLPVLALLLFSALSLPAQVSVRSLPPAVLLESTGSVSVRGQVLGALPGESTTVRWTTNDQPLPGSATVSYTLSDGPVGVPVILKVTSVLDPSKFAAVPVISLQKTTLTQVGFPEAVSYHPGTGKIYVAALVPRGNTFDTNLIEIAADGTQTPVLTFSSDIIDKLLPYSSGGTSYLLAPGFLSGSVHAVNLSTRTSRRVVTGLTTPVSGGFHPLSGDLYIAEQNARRVSIISRSLLDSAVTGTSTAAFQSLPIVITGISGIGFLSDRDSQKVFLLLSSTNGTIYRVNLEEASFSAVASGITTAQELLVVESSQLGFSFVMTASSTSIDGQGRIVATLPLSGDPSFSPAYSMATGLDSPTDLAFVPAGSPYSSQGRPLIAASNLSPTASRGKVVLWEVDPTVPADFFVFNDQARPSLSLISPAVGAEVVPGAPLEVRWNVAETNPVNPPHAHYPGPAEILVSTDGGNSFFSTGPAYIPSGPSGPQGNEYRVTLQLPANLAGSIIRLRVQMRGLGGSTLTVSSAGDLNVLPTSGGLPMAISLNPNFILAGGNAAVTVEGLNFRAGTALGLGDGISVNAATMLSSSRLAANITALPLASAGPRTVLLCNDVVICSQTENAFFVLPESGPRITSVQPPSGSPGATVVITGNNFSPLAANNVVTIGNLVATVSLAQVGRLVVQVPFGLNRGELPLSVQSNGVSSNTATFFLTPPGFSFPTIKPFGLVNVASYALGTSPLVAGSLGALFGSKMAPSIADAPSIPLPIEMLKISVVIGGIQAPLLFVAPDQINLQLPEEIRGLNSVPVTIYSSGVPGNTLLLTLTSQNPGIFSADRSGTGLGAVLNQNGSANGPGNPERIGNVLQIYATGLGESNPPVATGAGAPGNPPSNHLSPPQVTIDGKAAFVAFSGRAPNWVGLDQINVVIPHGVTTGEPVPLIFSIGGNTSNTVTVYVVP